MTPGHRRMAAARAGDAACGRCGSAVSIAVAVRRAVPARPQSSPSASALSPRSRTSRSRWRRASSSASSGRRAAARPRCCGRSPASIRRTRARIEIAGRDVSQLPPAAARFRHRLPVLRAVPQPDRRRRTSATASSTSARRAPRSHARVARAAGAGRPARAGRASIRCSCRAASSSASRSARALATSPVAAAAGRAALRARCAGARAPARRDQDAAAPPRRHHHHGDPRPGGGAGHGRPHRGDEPGRDRAGRDAGRDLPPPATAFVADFVGAMNFLDATSSGPSACGSARSSSPATAIAGLPHGSRVQLGLRPEEMRVRGVEPSDAERRRRHGRSCWISWAPSAARTLQPEAAPRCRARRGFLRQPDARPRHRARARR